MARPDPGGPLPGSTPNGSTAAPGPRALQAFGFAIVNTRMRDLSYRHPAHLPS